MVTEMGIEKELEKKNETSGVGMVEFQPFYSRELQKDCGLVYGLSRASKDLILTEHKKLKAPKGIVVARTGAGRCSDVSLGIKSCVE